VKYISWFSPFIATVQHCRSTTKALHYLKATTLFQPEFNNSLGLALETLPIGVKMRAI